MTRSKDPESIENETRLEQAVAEYKRRQKTPNPATIISSQHPAPGCHIKLMVLWCKSVCGHFAPPFVWHPEFQGDIQGLIMVVQSLRLVPVVLICVFCPVFLGNWCQCQVLGIFEIPCLYAELAPIPQKTSGQEHVEDGCRHDHDTNF